MADKRTRRQEKKRAKDKARQKALKKKSNERRRSGKVTAERASEWALSECWISDGWDERGAAVTAIFGRQDAATNRVAAAVLEMDLSEQGVVNAAVRLDLQLATYQGLVGQISEQVGMRVTAPGQIVRVLDGATELAERRGHTQPRAVAEVRALMGELPASGDEPLIGNEDEDGDTVRKKSGSFWSNLKSRLGLG